MKLTVETIRVKDMRFGEETCLKDGVIFVNKEDILAFAQHETCFETLKIDITYPGDSTRIINVVDVVQPRCKVSDNIDWPGVLTDDYEIAGSGVTRAVEGAGIVLCQNDTYWSRKWGSFDMSGECAAINPYAKMPELVIEPMAPEDADFREYREALRRIGFKTSVLLARVTLGQAADSSETCSIRTFRASPIRTRYIRSSTTRRTTASRCSTATPCPTPSRSSCSLPRCSTALYRPAAASAA